MRTSSNSPNNILASFQVIRKHFFKDKTYFLCLTNHTLTLSEGLNQKSPKYHCRFNIENTFKWIVESNKIVGFWLPYKGKQKDFYAKSSDLIFLKEKMGCLVSYVNLEQFYALENILEEGSFGRVWRGRSKLGQQIFAVKEITKNQNLNQIIKNEINILKTLQDYYSQNLLEVYEIFQSQTHFYIVTEYIEGNNLEVLLKNQNISFNQQEVLQLIEQILKGLLLIHQLDIIHRDIKPSNIMISHNKVKIIDFGLSCFSNKFQEQFPVCGTIGYCAPEVLKANSKSNYTTKADIFSVGCIFYELLTNKKVFKERKDIDIHNQNKKCLINIQEQGQLFDLIRLFLKEDPTCRIDCCQALQLIQNCLESKNFDVNIWYKLSFHKSSQLLNSQPLTQSNLFLF